MAKFLLHLLLALMAGTPVAAFAQESRWFVQVGVGSGEADGELEIPFVAVNAGLFSQPSPGDRNDRVWSAMVGYRVVGLLYVDVGYADLGEYEANRIGFRRPSAHIKELSLGARYVHPISDRFSAVWRLAVTQTRLDSDRLTTPGFGNVVLETQPIPDDNGLTWGTGILYGPFHRIRVSLMLNRHELERTDVTDLTLGINYSF